MAHPIIDARLDRKNGRLFFWATLFIYLSAPVSYVGITQANLCDKLGSSATIANLPATMFYGANCAPIVLASIFSNRWDKPLLVWSNILTAAFMALAAVILYVPVGAHLQIDVIVVQSALLGVLNSILGVYQYQCLGRGTTEEGRARTLKATFTWTPVGAVAGSLIAQYIVNGKHSWIAFPHDYGLLFVYAVPCTVIVAWASAAMEIPPIAEEPLPPFWASLWANLRRYATNRNLLILFIAYFVWDSSLMVTQNLSLDIRHSMGREPSDFTGYAGALRFGFKMAAGYLYGIMTLRYGVRAPLIAATSILGLSSLWAWVVHGYPYLACFGFLGMGELGGAYFPNTILSWSSPAHAAGDMAILNMALPLSGPAASIHGFLADHWGYSSSFAFGIATAGLGLILLLLLPKGSGNKTAA